MKLKNRWAGTRITFGFLECALCKQQTDHPALQEDLKPILELKEQVKNKALQRLKFVEGDKKLPELVEATSKWRNNPEGYAMYRFAYFLCYKCKQPYYGGERACEEERADFDPKELLCGGCSGVPGQEVCPTHGKDFIEYKCKFCCSMSVFFCWGTTHFCDACHKRAGTIARVPKEELPKCNCNVKHPPNGEEFCFGCAYCKIMQTF
jgi:E3 ubiquitin-protein ligase MYCBP2